MNWRRHRTTAAIVLSCLGLVAITWAIAIERIAYERERVIENAKVETANVAIAFEEHTLRSLKSINQTLALLKHEYLVNGREMDLDHVLRDAEVDTQHFTVGIFDRNGDYVAGTAKGTPTNGATREYFVVHTQRSDKLFVGRPTRRSYSGELVMVFSRRIEDNRGNFQGIVALSVAPGYFTSFFKTANLGPQGLLTLVGLDGVTRVRQVGKLITAGEDVSKSAVMLEQARRPHGALLTPGALEGIRRFANYRTLEHYPLVVTVGVSERDTLGTLEGPKKAHYRVAALVTVLLIVLAGLMHALMARQRRAHDLVARNESRFRAIFEQAFVGMGQHALDGRAVAVNQKMADILGYTRQEMVNIDPRHVVHPDDIPADGDFCGEFDSRERRFIRKDGAAIWVNASQTLVRNAQGRPDCYVSVVQDITALKRVNQMKSEFVSMVSHELRTPLTSIRGSLGLISGGVAGKLPDAAANLVNIAKSNCERLIRLINDILDTEKIESGNMRFEVKEVDMQPLLQLAIAANEGYAGQHDVRLQLEAPAEPVRVRADADRLIQVLTNLVSNAAKFSPAGQSVEVSMAVTGGRVRVEVRDQGPGIPEEFRGRMFEKFSQADSSDSRSKSGTGLGLNISKAIVERHGGLIDFTSEPGRGSTFFFELPLLDAALVAPVAADAGSAVPRAQRRCILICEDEPDIARLIAIMLDKAGYDSEIAYTAAEARARLQGRNFVAMTVDLVLPDEDGMSLIRALRDDPRTQALPIIVISAVAEQGRVQLNSEAHAVSDWLEKPIDENHLILAVHNAAEGAANGPPRVLHVEDDPDIQRVAAAIAQDFACFEFAGTLRQARAALARGTFDLVLLDIELPDGSGWDLAEEIAARRPDLPVVVFSVTDVPPQYVARAAAVLVKTDTSNEELLDAMRRVLKRGGRTPGRG